MTLAQNSDNPTQIQQFDFSVDLLKAILWQSNNATYTIGLINAKQSWYNENQQSFWEDWYTNVFNLATANDFGLSVWSQILDLPLYVDYQPSPMAKPTFGYNAAYFKNYDRGNYGSNFGGAVDLPTNIKRIALQLRYFQLISAGCIPEINRFLNYVFAPGTAYLLDGLDMTQTYVFKNAISADLKYLFDNFDILPRAAGVASKYIDATRLSFGYAPYGINYDRATYGA